jgi:drug/metabolite transporter (DMT)-like permease
MRGLFCLSQILMTRRQIFAYLTICLLWGSTWAAIRVGVQQVPPIRMAAIRFLAAGLLMLPIALHRKMVFPRGRALKATVAFGVVLIALQYALVFSAEQYISSGLTAVLYASSPLVVGIVSPRILRRPVPRAALTAMLVGVGGLFLLLRSIVATSTQEIVPALVMLVGVLMSSICSVYASKELKNVSTFASLALQFLIGGALLAVLSAGLERHLTARWTASAFGSLLFLIVCGSIVGFSLYFWLLKNVEPYRVVTVQFIIPIISVTEGTLLLHETIPFAELCGGLVVLAAVVLVLRVPPDDDSYLDILGGNQDRAR